MMLQIVARRLVIAEPPHLARLATAAPSHA